eukprot:9165496-Karenia_brevis.AAC.1
MQFTLAFKALGQTANHHAEKAHNILKPEKPGGVWTDLWVSGHKLYVNKDQSPQHARIASATRKLKG